MRRRDSSLPTVRSAAVRVVERVLAARSPADRLLARAGAPFDSRDRRLLSELVYGTLRWLRRIDHLVAGAAGRPLDAIDPKLVAVLRVATTQLATLERVPAHAAVSEAVDEARRRAGGGAAGFVNAVLRRIARSPSFADWPVTEREPVRRLAIESSHPDELVARWWTRFGEERTRAIVAADNGPRPLHLLAFAARGGRPELAGRLAEEGVATHPGELSPTALIVDSGDALASTAYARGELYVQDEASQAAAAVPAPRGGERVLDVAAAPGGKGLANWAREPSLAVRFADRSLPRALRLRQNLDRLRIAMPVVVADAAIPPWRACFDRVVVDAPCTGTGTLRRHPELRWRFGVDELARLAAASGRMLDGAATSVAVGGLLQLVTCSIEAEENEHVAARFLAAHPGFAPGVLDAASIAVADAVDPRTGLWRVFPGSGHDGFSVHVLHRRE